MSDPLPLPPVVRAPSEPRLENADAHRAREAKKKAAQLDAERRWQLEALARFDETARPSVCPTCGRAY